MIIPTIFSESISDFKKRYTKLKEITNYFHIDIMDGSFVNKKTPPANIICGMVSEHYDAHLMVDDPITEVDKLTSNCKRAIFHIESTTDCDKIISYTIKKGFIPVIAKHVDTQVSRIVPYLKRISYVMLMGVHAGLEKQLIDKKIYDDIKQVLSIKKVVIMIDGGVNDKTAYELSLAGADIICSGSFISSSQDPAGALNKLLMAYEKGKQRT